LLFPFCHEEHDPRLCGDLLTRAFRTNRGFLHADPATFVYELYITTELGRSLHDSRILAHIFISEGDQSAVMYHSFGMNRAVVDIMHAPDSGD
jgi:hypothetical protein